MKEWTVPAGAKRGSVFESGFFACTPGTIWATNNENYRFAICHNARTTTGVYRCAAESFIYTDGEYDFHMYSITPEG